MTYAFSAVMAGLDPAIYRGPGAGSDARVKPGHDDEKRRAVNNGFWN